MNARGAAVLGVFAIAFAVVVGTSTGPQTFTRVFTTPPVYGTGSSGSALAFHPTIDVGDFGDCSDGDITFTVNTALVRDVYYRNATINANVTVTTASFAFRACQTLTFAASTSLLSNNGNNGMTVSPGSGGATIAAGSLPGGANGGAGGGAGNACNSAQGPGVPGGAVNPAPNLFATTIVTAGAGGALNSDGGDGATGGIGQGGSGGGGAGGSGCTGQHGGAIPANIVFPTYGDTRDINQGMTGQTLLLNSQLWAKTMGGGGGGAGTVGGGGDTGAGAGGGAGWMVVGVRDIVGPGGITAIGGNGAPGAGAELGPGSGPCSGGGGGGSGGIVVIETETYGWSAASVAGGTGGAGGCTSPHGGAGGHGGPGILTIHYVRQP